MRLYFARLMCVLGSIQYSSASMNTLASVTTGSSQASLQAARSDVLKVSATWRCEESNKHAKLHPCECLALIVPVISMWHFI
jgi:hypothetical protein